MEVNTEMSKLTIDVVKTGQNIRYLRKKTGLRVRELQEVLGFTTPQSIYHWEHGRALPTVDNLVILSRILGVSVDDILILRGEM